MACTCLHLEDPEELTIDEGCFKMVRGIDKQKALSEATSTLTWAAARYLELCLFRYLQRASNDLTEKPAEEQIAYIICMFQVLLLKGGITTSLLESSGLVSGADHDIPLIY
jgi:hypothetical protein